LQSNIDTNKDLIDDLDSTYATDTQLSSAQSTLQSNIDTNKDLIDDLDSTYATDSQLSSAQSTLQSNIDTKQPLIAANGITSALLSDDIDLDFLNVKKDVEVKGNINFSGDLLKDGELYESGAFKKNAAGNAFFKTGQRVGIGTDNPSTALEVEGTIKSKQLIFEEQTVDANTINWNDSPRQYLNLSDSNATVQFTNPSLSNSNVVMLLLIVKNGENVTWPTNVRWPGGVTPQLSKGTDIVSFYYRDNNYYGFVSFNFE